MIPSRPFSRFPIRPGAGIRVGVPGAPAAAGDFAGAPSSRIDSRAFTVTVACSPHGTRGSTRRAGRMSLAGPGGAASRVGLRVVTVPSASLRLAPGNHLLAGAAGPVVEHWTVACTVAYLPGTRSKEDEEGNKNGAVQGSGRGGPTQVRPCRRQPARFWPRKSKKTQKNTHKIKIKSKLNQN